MSKSTKQTPVWRTTVRAADCDWFGHANNAIYADYVISAALSAWDGDFGASRWRMRAMEMDFKTPVSHGDEIEVSSRQAGRADGLLRSIHRIGRRGDGAAVAETTVSWLPHANESADGWGEESPALSAGVHSSVKTPNQPEAYVFRRKLRVQPYEVDHTGLVNPTWIFRWGWASMFAATAHAGWPQERMLSAGFTSFQRHRSAELLGDLHADDEIEVQSRLYDLHRIRATWEHRVLRDGSVVAIDRAEGAFLSLDGKLGPAPQGLMESLVAGRDVTAGDGSTPR